VDVNDDNAWQLASDECFRRQFIEQHSFRRRAESILDISLNG